MKPKYDTRGKAGCVTVSSELAIERGEFNQTGLSSKKKNKTQFYNCNEKNFYKSVYHEF